jgi:hypothetical protein
LSDLADSFMFTCSSSYVSRTSRTDVASLKSAWTDHNEASVRIRSTISPNAELVN